MVEMELNKFINSSILIFEGYKRFLFEIFLKFD